MNNNNSEDNSWLLKNNTDSQSVASYYDNWAANYDKELARWGYNSPEEVSARLSLVSDRKAKILDVGCGTGLCGLALFSLGFKDITGIDVSINSLRQARSTEKYTRLQKVDLHSLPLPFSSDSYDAAICVGVLTYIRNEIKIFEEFCRLIKPQGYVIFTCRDDLYTARQYHKIIDAFEKDGRWQLIEQSESSPYLPQNPIFGEKIQVRYTMCKVI